MRLSDLTIRALKAPANGAQIHYDDIVPGFGVRVSQQGTKSFVLTHGRRRHRETIGRVGILSLQEARGEAKRRLAEFTLGKQKPRSMTWKGGLREFLEEVESRCKPRTHIDYIVGGTNAGKTQLLQHLILHDLQSDDPPALVIVDSQTDLIQKISHLDIFHPETGRLRDRLTLITPRDINYPPALNIFDINQERLGKYDEATKEQVTAGVIQTFEYVFMGLLGADLSAKQDVFFRFVARLMLAIPDTMGRTAEDVKARGYNLDIKNPHTAADDHGDPEVLLESLNAAEAETATLRDQLKAILAEALTR